MEDGPESAEGSYEFGDKTYRLNEAASEVWSVYDGETYIGILRAVDPSDDESGPLYVAKTAGEESDPHGEATDDWRAALEHLIDTTQE